MGFHLLKKHNILMSILLLAMFCFLFSGCSNDSQDVFFINDSWSCCPVETGSSIYTPVSSSSLSDLTSFLPEREGYIWLQNNFSLPEDFKDKELSVFLGKLRISAKAWLNGEYIGSVGRFPPNNFIPGTNATSFLLPEKILERDGNNVLKLLVYVNGVGGISTETYIGEDDYIESVTRTYNFRNSGIAFGAACILLIVGIAYLAVWSARKKSTAYLHYSLMNIASACYLAQFYVAELPFLQNMSYLTFCKLVLALSAFITGYFATSFIRAYFHWKDTDNIFIIRISLLFVPSLIALCITDVATFMEALPFLYVFLAAQIGFAVWAVIVEFRKKSKDAARLLTGFSPVLLGILIDFILFVFSNDTEIAYFTVFGWQGVIIVFFIDLALRLKEIYTRLEFLNTKLEQQVLDRTKNLSDVNQLLEKEQKRSNADIAMAERVQRSFLIPDETKFEDWDIAVCYQPLSGVSGDLYDIYSENETFYGTSLFDVSGHGMAAGLVTMLSKNIISNQFHAGLKVKKDQASPSTLTQVMYAVNNAIIDAKGDIENYLTGAIMRVAGGDDGGACELVNAGNPFPMLNHDGKITELKPEVGKTQMGMIGIDGLDVSFPTINFRMEPGDSFILFTDGLTEAENKFGEQFGVSRLTREFSDCSGLSAQEQLDYIMHCHKSFTGSNPHEDDITVVVVHRNKKAAE
ncbi:MAG: SpoIIE family protein phosphatase [Treponema sp.]|nr:SpoIIE family protein phosphatase [Candidatus Treponema caballi]